jgi:HEAT repeat protein
MRCALVLVVVLGGVAAGHADEPDDLLARKLGAMVRDVRLTTAARAEAARTLGKLGPRAAVAVPDMIAVFDRLRGTEQEPLQEALVESLGQIGGPARLALLSLPKGLGRTADIDLAIKRATELILAAPDTLDIDLLVQQLQSRDAGTRLRAVKELGERGQAARGAVPGLLLSIADPDGDVRRGAIVALRRIQPDARPTEALIRAIAIDLRNPDANLRLLAVRALGRIGPPAGPAAPEIEALRADPDPDIRRAAVEALTRITAPPP